jgi:hypothetical protein
MSSSKAGNVMVSLACPEQGAKRRVDGSNHHRKNRLSMFPDAICAVPEAAHE